MVMTVLLQALEIVLYTTTPGLDRMVKMKHGEVGVRLGRRGRYFLKRVKKYVG